MWTNTCHARGIAVVSEHVMASCHNEEETTGVAAQRRCSKRIPTHDALAPTPQHPSGRLTGEGLGLKKEIWHCTHTAHAHEGHLLSLPRRYSMSLWVHMLMVILPFGTGAQSSFTLQVFRCPKGYVQRHQDELQGIHPSHTASISTIKPRKRRDR